MDGKSIAIRKSGLGAFHVLDDELLLELLGTFEPALLLSLSLTSHVMYIYCEEDVELVGF